MCGGKNLPQKPGRRRACNSFKPRYPHLNFMISSDRKQDIINFFSPHAVFLYNPLGMSCGQVRSDYQQGVTNNWVDCNAYTSTGTKVAVMETFPCPACRPNGTVYVGPELDELHLVNYGTHKHLWGGKFMSLIVSSGIGRSEN